MPDSTLDFRLAYDKGTLILLDPPPDYEPPSLFIWDARFDRWRAQAHRYREIVEYFRTLETVPKATAPRYNTLRLEFTSEHNPHPLQAEALKAWQNFVRLSARSSAGRRAMLAYRRYRKLALGTASKLRVLEDLLKRHPRDRLLIFTNDNETVYNISQQFLIPAITHQTRTKERRAILRAFNTGDILALVTSRVLNEGVNVPEANVAIILSGTGTIREHVQRLGRILRRREGKQAILYEVISRNTVEDNISRRRRQHDAYDGAQEKS